MKLTSQLIPFQQDHSRHPWRGRVAIYSVACMTCGLVLSLLAIIPSASSASLEEQARLDDLAGQIEYAFYAQERVPLQQAVQTLEGMVAQDNSPAARVWLNYGRWKTAQLTARTAANTAADVASRCVAASWPDKEPARVQAVGHALNAACAELLAELQPLRSVFHRRDRQRELQQALAIGSKQAQVHFVAAWIAQHNGDMKSAHESLQRAAVLYDANGHASDTTTGDLGEWGQAEMFYLLGKLENDRHDTLAARNALERALVLAPDYRDAAVLIKTLSVR